MTCPSWHYLAGPHQDDDERRNCAYKDTHAKQRAHHDMNQIIVRATENHIRGYRSVGEEVYGNNPICRWCEQPWPCEVSQLLVAFQKVKGP